MSLGNISTIHSTKNISNNAGSAAVNSEVGFYEIGAFAPNVKRVRDGADQLEVLQKNRWFKREGCCNKTFTKFFQKYSFNF